MTATLAEMTAEYLSIITASVPAETVGYLVVAVGSDPYLSDKGKYKHHKWFEEAFRWPAQQEQAVGFIQHYAVRGDVYVCPYLMKTADRNKGNAAWRALVHCDIDTTVDPCTVAELGGFVVWSGTAGHGHIYVPLSWPVTPEQHRTLCDGLVVYFGGDKGKVTDNDLLRPPGSLNHKPTLNGGVPIQVHVNGAP